MKKHSKRTATGFMVLSACLMTALPPSATFAAEAAEDRALNIRHATAGKAIDSAYHDAGIRVDLVNFDLMECIRQGKDAPKALLEQIDQSDRDMRREWLALDLKQRSVAEQLRMLPVSGNYQLSIQSLEDGPASEVGWFAFRSASLAWSDGTTLAIPLKSFRNNLYDAKYSYLCEPSAVVSIYGRQSTMNTTVAGFDVEPLPDGDAKLIISGLDCDKPGVTRIRILVNTTEVFKGENPYRKKGWSEHAFPVPAKAFDKPMTAEAVGKRLIKDLIDLERQVAPFSARMKEQADRIEKEAAPFLKGLVYKPRTYRRDDWQRQFIRGMCVGYIADYEHTAKSLREAGTTMIYGYLTPEKYAVLAKELDRVGIPYVGVGWTRHKQPKVLAWDTGCYVNTQKLQETAEMFFSDYGKSNKSYVGIAFDEPRLIDSNIQKLPKEEYSKFVAAFNDYLTLRRPSLEKAGITLPAHVEPIMKIESSRDVPLWMEWQMFKKQQMKGFFSAFWEYCRNRGYLFLPLVNNQQPVMPQLASFLSAGAVPLVGTDLYNNGALREGFSMHLLHTCASGKAIMTPGSGYSCKSTDRFRRSLCTGMIHADGILQWIYPYTSKYRDPDYFWRTGGKKDDRDDRGREPFDHWKPEYWDIQKDVFGKAEKAEPYLMNIKSIAQTLLLYSERTAIAGSAQGAGVSLEGRTTLDYFDDEQGVYSDLVAQSRPLDLCFIEAMSAARLKQYRVCILADARLMTEQEAGMIRDWVNGGGTLVASAETSLYDEWGRKREDFALADLFGVHYTNTRQGVSRFDWNRIPVRYDKGQDYAQVTVAPDAEVLAKWDNGDPALLSRKAGNGHVWFLTMRRPGLRLERSEPKSALFGSGASGVGRLLGRFIEDGVRTDAVSVGNAPNGVEVQVRKTAAGAYVVHLMDWFDERTLRNLSLDTHLAGQWDVFNPFTGEAIGSLKQGAKVTLPPFQMYQIVVLKKHEQ
ncbi:MAG: beta-galactosidase trimerization domain-containing protein [Kiritimatiellae bacterium]|nr:beta-galactosidase trimerization domain-containing protein [Kiritimatiellia bacterium]